MAQAVLAHGGNVVATARDPDTIRDIVTADPTRALAVRLDVTDPAQIAEAVHAAEARFGSPDVLVNNAGYGYRAAVEEAPDRDIRDLFETNFHGLIAITKALLPGMRARRSGYIINISSISGHGASARSAPYAAVKAAINNYTMSQALMLTPKRIRVNAIAPGSIEFPGGVWDQRKTSNPALYEGTLRSIPWGRMGKPEEVAQVAAFLASDLAGWVTGQTIAVDGGQLL